MNVSRPDILPRYRAGVGLMLINDEGMVLVGRRVDTAHAWQMPQGGIDKGETPRAAAIRELTEEIGTGSAEIVAESSVWRHYDLPPRLSRTLWGGRYLGQAQKWFLLRFTGSDEDIDLRATPHVEFDDWRWVPVEQLDGLIVPFKRAVYAEVLSEFMPAIRSLRNG